MAVALAGTLALSAAVPATVASAEGDTVLHVVQRGENLFRLAILYGVPLRELMAANGIPNPDYLRAGQVLIIPGGQRSPELEGALNLASAAPAPIAHVTTVPDAAIPEAAPAVERHGVQTHVVARGENLFRIAQRYSVSVTALVQANSLLNPDMVTAGQTLVIPDGTGAGGGERSAATFGGGPRDVSLQPLVTTPTAFSSIPQPDNIDGVDFTAAPWFRLTYYCLPGTMASGRTVYLGAVAADQSVFALGTRLLVEGYGFFTVEDRFAWDARQPRLDVWVPTCWEAVQRGVQYRRVFVVVPR